MPFVVQAAVNRAGSAEPWGCASQARPRPKAPGRRRDGQHSCCANCGTEETCLWRRDKTDASRVLCNACGIYKATNGVDRSLAGKAPGKKQGKQLAGSRSVSGQTCINMGWGL